LNEKFGLRDEKFQLQHDYEFMLYPGMNERVVVTQVFHSSMDRNRLLLVEIPERQTFDPKYLMIVLSHEIGHFVGSKLRMRERRYEVLKESLIRLVGLHTYLDYGMSKFFTIDGFSLVVPYHKSAHQSVPLFLHLARHICHQLYKCFSLMIPFPSTSF